MRKEEKSENKWNVSFVIFFTFFTGQQAYNSTES